MVKKRATLEMGSRSLKVLKGELPRDDRAVMCRWILSREL